MKRHEATRDTREILKRHKEKVFHCEHSSAVEKLSREGGEPPALEIFKTWLDKALSNMLSFQIQLCLEEEIGQCEV